MEKIYLVELIIFKEHAIYGLQEILLDTFLFEVPSWMVRACKKSR